MQTTTKEKVRKFKNLYCLLALNLIYKYLIYHTNER